MKVRQLYAKYKDVIPYAIFGVLTTVVNTVVYYILTHLFGLLITLSTIVAWITAVLFAYITNRKWVFHSAETTKTGIAKEIAYFFACRLATGVIDWLCMYVFVEVLSMNDVLIKILANILVIILNYIASKLLIFKNTKKQDGGL